MTAALNFLSPAITFSDILLFPFRAVLSGVYIMFNKRLFNKGILFLFKLFHVYSEAKG